jgi:hypothetical protein
MSILRVRAKDLRSLAMSALPRVAAEWRVLGQSFEGTVYFVYEASHSLATSSPRRRMRGTRASRARRLARRCIASQPRRPNGHIFAGAKIVDPGLVVRVLRHRDADLAERVRVFCAPQAPKDALPAVLMDASGLQLTHLATPPEEPLS